MKEYSLHLTSSKSTSTAKVKVKNGYTTFKKKERDDLRMNERKNYPTEGEEGKCSKFELFSND